MVSIPPCPTICSVRQQAPPPRVNGEERGRACSSLAHGDRNWTGPDCCSTAGTAPNSQVREDRPLGRYDMIRGAKPRRAAPSTYTDEHGDRRRGAVMMAPRPRPSRLIRHSVPQPAPPPPDAGPADRSGRHPVGQGGAAAKKAMNAAAPAARATAPNTAASGWASTSGRCWIGASVAGPSAGRPWVILKDAEEILSKRSRPKGDVLASEVSVRAAAASSASYSTVMVTLIVRRRCCEAPTRWSAGPAVDRLEPRRSCANW